MRASAPPPPPAARSSGRSAASQSAAPADPRSRHVARTIVIRYSRVTIERDALSAARNGLATDRVQIVEWYGELVRLPDNPEREHLTRQAARLNADCPSARQWPQASVLPRRPRAPVTAERWGDGRVAESGWAMSSRDFCSASTPRKAATRPPLIITPAPMR